jgi:hypothetical protein
MADLGDNPDAMAAIVSAFGGTPIPARTFQFELPMGKVREVIPKISELTGLRVEKVRERTEAGDVAGIDRIQTVVTLELKRKLEPTEYESQRNLMSVCIK